MERQKSEIEEICANGNLNKSNVIHLLSNLRQIIEEHTAQSQYPVLNLYCNWVLHPIISGSNTAFRILEQLTDAMIAHNSDQGTQWINDAVIEGMQLHVLQLEILEFSRKYNIAVEILKSEFFWRVFAKILLDILCDKPLVFPKKLKDKAKDIHDRIVIKAHMSGNMVNGVMSVWFENIDGKHYWSINTLAKTKTELKIMGLMYPITQRMVEKCKTQA